jgi:hypothetical protein
VKRYPVLLLLCAAAAAVVEPGCGKKGPPLAPTPRMPAPVGAMAAVRQANTAAVRFSIPATNTDGKAPADIGKVEVYAYTAFKDTDVKDPRDMTLVATIKVRKPIDPDAPPPKPGKPLPAPEPGEEQGWPVVAFETLTPEMRTPTVPAHTPLAPVPPAPRVPATRRDGSEAEVTPALWAYQPEAQPYRLYVVYGATRHGKRGPASTVIGAVPLDEPPPPPKGLRFEVTEKAVVLSWDFPGANLPPKPSPDEDEPLKTTAKWVKLQPPTAFNVYLADKTAVAQATVPPYLPGAKVPSALTPQGVFDLTWSDPKVEFGVEQCYVVRTIGPTLVESAPTPIGCVTPADTFPPPPPTGLAAVASEGAVSLIWEGVAASDLAGYVVLRGSAPNGPMLPLFDTPIRETTFRDATAKPGVRYTYAVVSVDTATPPNRSKPSNTVEETAR